MSDSIILRTSPSRTLPLAKSLREAGFAVWSPEESRIRRRPRSQREAELSLPIVPGFVFADAGQQAELLALSRSPGLIYRVWDSELKRMVAKGHPHFSVFRSGGSVPRVTAGDLAPLHIIEDRLRDLAAERRERARRRGPVPAFVIGQAVRLPGAFEGLDLIVMAIDGATVHLSRPGWTLPPVVISAWNLEAALPRAA